MKGEVIEREMTIARYLGEAVPVPEDAMRQILLDQAGAGTSITTPDTSRVSRARVTYDDRDESPIAPPGKFGQAMTSIACNADSNARGIFKSAFEEGTNKEVNEQLT